MQQTRVTQWQYVALMVVVVGLVVAVVRMPRGEVDLCRRIFQGLASGNVSVQGWINWERLQALDVNIGQAYTKLPNDKEKAGYRRAFIENFEKGFAQSGGTTSAFVDWRVLERTKTHTIVAANYQGKGKTLLFTMPRSGKKKLVGLQWQ